MSVENRRQLNRAANMRNSEFRLKEIGRLRLALQETRQQRIIAEETGSSSDESLWHMIRSHAAWQRLEVALRT